MPSTFRALMPDLYGGMTASRSHLESIETPCATSDHFFEPSKRDRSVNYLSSLWPWILDFLTEEQKQALFYENGAQFFGVEKEVSGGSQYRKQPNCPSTSPLRNDQVSVFGLRRDADLKAFSSSLYISREKRKGSKGE